MRSAVSILLPFSGNSNFLSESIESIIRQDFLQWELILIDNGASTDAQNVAGEASRKDSRIKIITESNSGIAHALNAGIMHSEGKYIARMDSDDYSFPDRISKQFQYLEAHPSTGVVACMTEINPVTDRNEGFLKFVEWQNTISSAFDHARSRFIESPIAHPSVMIRRELFERYGKYAHGIFPEDYELWLRWMQAGISFVKLPEILLRWRDHPERMSRVSPAYSENAFYQVKSKYLSHYIGENLDVSRKIIVCGAGKKILPRINELIRAGVRIDFVTDIKRKMNHPLPFLPVDELSHSKNHFVINLIAKRGVRDDISIFLREKGFIEMDDFILAA